MKNKLICKTVGWKTVSRCSIANSRALIQNGFLKGQFFSQNAKRPRASGKGTPWGSMKSLGLFSCSGSQCCQEYFSLEVGGGKKEPLFLIVPVKVLEPTGLFSYGLAGKLTTAPLTACSPLDTMLGAKRRRYKWVQSLTVCRLSAWKYSYLTLTDTVKFIFCCPHCTDERSYIQRVSNTRLHSLIYRTPNSTPFLCSQLFITMTKY